MCEKNESCIDRTVLLVTLIPFLLGGIVFSITGLHFLDTLPQKIVSVYDRIFVVFVAFLDMGSTCAVASFTLFVLLSKLKNHLVLLRNRRLSLKNQT